MDSILNYIVTEQGNFGRITNWQDFIDEVKNSVTQAPIRIKKLQSQAGENFGE